MAGGALDIGLDDTTFSWLRTEVLAGDAVVRTRRLPGGSNHDMILLTTEFNDQYVMRRYRLRNPCATEMALATRLADTVPMVDLVAADPDGQLIGAPTLVYRYVDGVPLNEVLDKRVGREYPALGRAVGATLAQIGAVRFPSPGCFRDGSLATDGQDLLIDLAGVVERSLAVGNADHGLTKAEQEGFRELATRSEPWVEVAAGSRQLVHMDFNPKNLLVHYRDGRWEVAAVIDWEFAFSGSPLTDVGNMLRFADSYPPGYVDGFRLGYAEAGGRLPDGWREISRALDLFTLAEILTHAPDDVLFGKVATLVRQRLRKVPVRD